jgi:hypothetical protein
MQLCDTNVKSRSTFTDIASKHGKMSARLIFMIASREGERAGTWLIDFIGVWLVQMKVPRCDHDGSSRYLLQLRKQPSTNRRYDL